MKESKPKYLEIADAIHQEIRQEIYKQGDKLPVERELQERFGASRMTIRHALQKLDTITAASATLMASSI